MHQYTVHATAIVAFRGFYPNDYVLWGCSPKGYCPFYFLRLFHIEDFSYLVLSLGEFVQGYCVMGDFVLNYSSVDSIKHSLDVRCSSSEKEKMLVPPLLRMCATIFFNLTKNKRYINWSLEKP